MNLIDRLMQRLIKPAPRREAEVNSLDVNKQLTLDRVERLSRIGRIDAEVAARVPRTRSR